MNAPLYNAEILRLAAADMPERLVEPMGSAEKRSPICGSRVTVDVAVDEDGRVNAVGMLVRACALGQASSSLLAASVLGHDAAELERARDDLTRWLAGEGSAPSWPGLNVFTPALDRTARHPSIRLAFEAAAEAAAQATTAAEARR